MILYVIETISIILLPYLIRAGYSFYYSYKNKSNLPASSVKPALKWKQYCLLIGSLIAAYYLIYNRRYINFYATINAHPSDPSFVIRNALRDFVATQRANDEYFEEPNEDLIYPKLLKIAPEVEVLSSYDYYVLLYELLKVKENKMNYLRYGDAFVNCDWCSEYFHYGIYKFSLIISDYFWLFLSLGLFKQRSFASIPVLGMLMFEISVLFCPEDVYNEVAVHIIDVDLYAFTLRNLVFAFVLVCCGLGEFYPSKQSKMDEIRGHYSGIIAQLQRLRLDFLSVSLNKGLRRRYAEFYEQKEKDRKVVFDEMKDVVAQWDERNGKNGEIVREYYGYEDEGIVSRSNTPN